MSLPIEIRPARKLQRYPQTSEAKARLCEGLRPVLTDFHDTIHRLAMKGPDRVAGDFVTALADLLGEELRRLLRGEEIGDYFTRTPVPDRLALLQLSIRTAAMGRALDAFRRRYFGWHPLLQADGWHVTGRFGIAESQRLLPRIAACADTRPRAAARRRIAARLAPFEDGSVSIAAAMAFHRAPLADSSHAFDPLAG